MTDTDKPTNRTPEPSHTVQAIRNSVLHAIRERDQALARVDTLESLIREVMDMLCNLPAGGIGSDGPTMDELNEAADRGAYWDDDAVADMGQRMYRTLDAAIKGIDSGGRGDK